MRQGDTLARLGGDEFLVVLEGLQHAADAAQVAAKVLSALSQPFDIAGHTLFTSCSIGVSVFPDDAADERALMRNADVAMYHAKERGRSNYQFFSPDMNTRAVERLTLETALRLALEREEFLLHYQPQLDIRTGRIVGMEALIRWQHPAWGLLSPDKFIPVAEESGLIEPLGEWILLSACRQARAWQLAGLPALKIAVNISARQLQRPVRVLPQGPGGDRASGPGSGAARAGDDRDAADAKRRGKHRGAATSSASGRSASRWTTSAPAIRA